MLNLQQMYVVFAGLQGVSDDGDTVGPDNRLG